MTRMTLPQTRFRRRVVHLRLLPLPHLLVHSRFVRQPASTLLLLLCVKSGDLMFSVGGAVINLLYVLQFCIFLFLDRRVDRRLLAVFEKQVVAVFLRQREESATDAKLRGTSLRGFVLLCG